MCIKYFTFKLNDVYLAYKILKLFSADNVNTTNKFKIIIHMLALYFLKKEFAFCSIMKLQQENNSFQRNQIFKHPLTSFNRGIIGTVVNIH